MLPRLPPTPAAQGLCRQRVIRLPVTRQARPLLHQQQTPRPGFHPQRRMTAAGHGRAALLPVPSAPDGECLPRQRQGKLFRQKIPFLPFLRTVAAKSPPCPFHKGDQPLQPVRPVRQRKRVRHDELPLSRRRETETNTAGPRRAPYRDQQIRPAVQPESQPFRPIGQPLQTDGRSEGGVGGKGT